MRSRKTISFAAVSDVMGLPAFSSDVEFMGTCAVLAAAVSLGAITSRGRGANGRGVSRP